MKSIFRMSYHSLSVWNERDTFSYFLWLINIIFSSVLLWNACFRLLENGTVKTKQNFELLSIFGDNTHQKWKRRRMQFLNPLPCKLRAVRVSPPPPFPPSLKPRHNVVDAFIFAANASMPSRFALITDAATESPRRRSPATPSHRKPGFLRLLDRRTLPPWFCMAASFRTSHSWFLAGGFPPASSCRRWWSCPGIFSFRNRRESCSPIRLVCSDRLWLLQHAHLQLYSNCSGSSRHPILWPPLRRGGGGPQELIE